MSTTTTPKTPLENVENPSIEMRVKYPGEWWMSGWKEEIEMKKKVISEISSGDIIGISDTDTDGLACLSMLMVAFQDKEVARVPSGHGATIDVATAMGLVVTHANDDVPVYVSDIKPDGRNADALYHLFDMHDGPIYLFDHHEWDDETVEAYKNVADVTIKSGEADDGNGLCAANLVYQELEEELANCGKDFEELVKITRDHDVWIKEDERSDSLSTLQAELDEFDYIKKISELGADVLEDEEVCNLIEEVELETNKKIEVAAKKANWSRIVKTRGGEVRVLSEGEELKPMEEVEDEIIVAFAYGTAYRSGLGNVLTKGWDDWLGEEYTREFVPGIDYESSYRPGDADLMVLTKPWNKTSLRSSEDYPICNVIAEEIGGGGHNEAAGCQPDIVGEEITYGEHWETEGLYVNTRIQEVIVSLVEDGLLEDCG